MTEELKADYAKSVDCLKLPNGKIVEYGSYPYFSKYSIVDGKVSQNNVEFSPSYQTHEAIPKNTVSAELSSTEGV